mmetsp:Transcript_55646/g.120190  ORF Transcript_55646/g.120190 Transcript_55646/m.120190 type:complete len:463 (-) Transcript_55646:122-1510(-)
MGTKAALRPDDEENKEEGGPPKKKVKKKARIPSPQDLEPGTVVLYWGGLRGVVRDAFAPLDEFWLVDEATGDVVMDEGKIVQFKASELQLLAPPPIARPRTAHDPPRGPWGGVLILGTERQMLESLNHFGAPANAERHTPQQLLAIPCPMCEPQSLLPTASEGIDESLRELAASLRPDIHVAFRTFHMKQAVERLGPDFLRLDSYFCLCAVQLPFGHDDIELVEGWERHWREDTCNQIDLCVTASGCWLEEKTAQEAAKRALGEQTGLCISDVIWGEEEQRGLRRHLGIESLPLSFTDVNGMEVTALVLPDDLTLEKEHGVLCFTEAPGVDYAALKRPGSMPGVAAARATQPQPAKRQVVQEPSTGRAATTATEADRHSKKTVNDWEAEQDKFAGLPALPKDWIRVKSQSSGDVYYFNKRTQESTFELPLPEGWTKQVSKSTGKTYYFNAKRKESTFERPIA